MYFSAKLFRNISTYLSIKVVIVNNRYQTTSFQKNIKHRGFKHQLKNPIYSIHTLRKNMSEFIVPNSTPFGFLDCRDAFYLLTEKEKFYSHYLARASWMGGLIILVQTSVESPLIFGTLHRLFSLQSIEDIKKIALEQCDFTEDDFAALLMYTSAVFANLGNYKGFGDSKFVPNLDKDKFKKLILQSKLAEHSTTVQDFLSWGFEPMYSLKDNEKYIGFPYKGITKYLSKNFLEEDNKPVTNFLKEKDMEFWNSRLIKTVENGTASYEIKFASVLATGDEEDKKVLNSPEVKDSCKFSITRGDYSQLMKLMNMNLQHAQAYAANENEVQMLSKYIESFHTGSLDAHKDGSRFWVKDKEPIIETYIGFIENYRDPAGVRGEFEGFVAMVNKPMSAKFAELVKLSEELISLLPWPSCYEKDKFLQPDFSSLDLLAFATGDLPIGINIPNYDEIRQNEGFKNVTLGNVIAMKSEVPPNFLNKNDQELSMKFLIRALEVQTGLHELLGHGSGKLFQKREDGSFNFDAETVNYETNEKVSSWYEKGESFSSVFSSLSSPYEECRAECVGLFLSTVPEVLKIFGLEGEEANDVMYVNWIDCIRAGLEALKCYDPKSESWLQAHGQAAYVMLQVLLECEGNFVTIEKTTGEDGNPDLLFTMDRTKILSHGKPCIAAFLKKLQLYKSTADKDSATKMFGKYSAVKSEDKHQFLEYREIVMARKKPRRLIVQANTFIEDNEVKLNVYEASAEGMIKSVVERYQGIDIYEILLHLWKLDLEHFS